MSRFNTIGSHKTVVYDSGGYTIVKYYYTDVVSFNSREIILNTGCWDTPTTKLRMNQTSQQFRLGYVVYQKDYEWYVEYKGKIYEFKESRLVLNRKED